MVQTPVSGKDGPVSIQPGDRNNWFAHKAIEWIIVSFVLLSLPGLPGLKVVLGKVSLLLLTEKVEESFLCLRHTWSTSLPSRTHYGGLLVPTSASAEDSLIDVNK